MTYHLSYAFVDATYQSTATLASVTDAAGVSVRPGDRIPGIPSQNLKIGGEVALLDTLWIGAHVISVSGNDLRGAGDGLTAKVAGYTLLNLSVRYEPVKHLEIWGRVDNATNARYATAGALHWNAFSNPISVERFVAPARRSGGGPA